MRSIKMLIVLAALVCAPAIYADTPATPTTAHAATATVEHATPTAEHKDPALEGSVEEVMAAAGETAKVATDYFTGNKEGDKTAKAVGLAMIIAVLLKLLLALLKVTSPFWKETKGKWVLRLITLTVGAAAAILANVVAGMDWWNAIIVFFSGPGSVLLTEYQKMVVKSKKE